MSVEMKIFAVLALAAILFACGDSGAGSASTAPAPSTQERVKQHLEAAGREIEQAADEAATQARPALHRAAEELRQAAHDAAEKVSRATETKPGSLATQP